MSHHVSMYEQQPDLARGAEDVDYCLSMIIRVECLNINAIVLPLTEN